MVTLVQKKISLLTDNGKPVCMSCLEVDKLQRRGIQLPTLIELLSILKAMKKIPTELRPSTLLTSQLLAYPESGGVFRKGVDILDVIICEGAKPLVLEAKYIPEGAFEKPNIGLLVTPELFVPCECGVVFIEPRTIIIVDALLQVSREKGKINPLTGIPEQVSPEVLATLNPEEIAMFYRKTTMGIKPLDIEIFLEGNALDPGAYYDSNQPFEIPILEAV